MIPATSILNETAYLHALLDSMDDSVLATDADFVICYWNENAAQLFGFPTESTIGIEALTVFPFIFSAEKKAAVQKILNQQGTWKKQVPYKSPEDKLLLLDITINMLRSSTGDTTGYVVVCRNVTRYEEQKKPSAAAEIPYRNSTLFETFMENSPIMSWIMDRNGIIKHMNPSCMKTFQLTKDAIGKPMQAVFPTSLSTSIQENIAIVYRLKQPFKSIESTTSQDGVEHFYQIIKFPIETEEGMYIGGWAIDITEENSLRCNLSESLVKLKKSETSLKEALTKEHHLNDMKSRFVSMASHEFRTPLSTILSSIYLLERYTTTEQQANRLKHAAKIKEAIQHLNDLLEDFLTLGKLEEGKTNIKPCILDAQQLLTDIVEELEPIKKEGQEIRLSFTGDSTITSDKQIVKNIMINLLNNAIKFSGENKPIHLSAIHESGKLRIVIKDEGIGISQADQALLFQTFFRGKNAQNIQGTGLGLNIVKQYLALLRGTIQIQSELDKGTSVSVCIPDNGGQ
jgi:PAS domain S-box-containing protein